MFFIFSRFGLTPQLSGADMAPTWCATSRSTGIERNSEHMSANSSTFRRSSCYSFLCKRLLCWGLRPLRLSTFINCAAAYHDHSYRISQSSGDHHKFRYSALGRIQKTHYYLKENRCSLRFVMHVITRWQGYR